MESNIFTEIMKIAIQNARSRFDSEPKDKRDPVQAMTDSFREMKNDAVPYWLHDSKKKNDRDLSWGPETPLGAGDAAERNSQFAAGMNIVFGGV